MTIEEFLALEPQALRDWLLPMPDDEIISEGQDGSSCPLAVFARKCGLPEVHVGRSELFETYEQLHESYGNDTYSSLPLPTWMQMFVRGVDRMKSPPVTAGQAWAIMDEIDGLLEG